MSIRYLIRNKEPDLSSDNFRPLVKLAETLGLAGPHKRRTVSLRFSELRFAHYQFQSIKEDTDWKWKCPSIELEAEDERALIELAKHYGVPDLPFLRGEVT